MKKARIISDAEVLAKSSVSLTKKAEAAKGVQQMRNFVVKANSHRRLSSEKQHEVQEVGKLIAMKLEDVKNMC